MASAQSNKVDRTVEIDIIDNPGNFINDENVLFNGPVEFGSVVTGHTNRTSTNVDFYNAGEDLIGEMGNGQAHVMKTDGTFDFRDDRADRQEPVLQDAHHQPRRYG